MKNRLFYFGSYQGLRLRQPQTRQATVETPQFRDFVLRTRPNSIAARLLRDFPPAADPTFNIRDIGSPAPGVQVAGPADGIPDLGDVFIPVRGFTDDDQYSLRLDSTFNESRDTSSFRFSFLDQERQSASGNSVQVVRGRHLRTGSEPRPQSHTRVRPSIVNDLRLGYNFDPQLTDGNYPEIPWVTMNAAGRSASTFGSSPGFVFPLDIRTATYQVYDALSINQGRDTVSN